MPKSVPERWEEYCPIGRRIKQSRFIAFKVPLKEAICANLNFELRWTLDDLLNQCPEIGMIIDLTLTARYYNFKEVLNKGVDYCKIACPGQVIPPEPLVRRFFSAIDTYLENHHEDDTLIGIHCTHGVNRSGYMIARYLIQRMGYSPDYAVECIGDARGHPMERQNYVKYLSKHTELVPKVLDSSDILRSQTDPSNKKLNKVRGFNVKRPIGNAMADKFKGNSRGRGGIRDGNRRGGKIFRDRAPDSAPHWEHEETPYQEEFQVCEDDRNNSQRKRRYNLEHDHEEQYEPMMEENYEENRGNDDKEHFPRHDRYQLQGSSQFNEDTGRQQWGRGDGNEERFQKRKGRPFNSGNDQHFPTERGNYGRTQQRTSRGGYRGGYNRGNNRFTLNRNVPPFEHGTNQTSKPPHQDFGGGQQHNPSAQNQRHYPPPNPPPTYGTADWNRSPQRPQDHSRQPEQWVEKPYDDLPPPPKRRAIPPTSGPRNRPFNPPHEPRHDGQHQFNSVPQQRRGRSMERNTMSPDRRGHPSWDHPPHHISPVRGMSPPNRRRMEIPPRRPFSPPQRPGSPPRRVVSPGRRHEETAWPANAPHHEKQSNRYGDRSRGEPSGRVSPSYQRGNTPGHRRMSPLEPHIMGMGSNERVIIPPPKRTTSPHYPRGISPPRREKSPQSRAHYRIPPSEFRRTSSPNQQSSSRKLSPGNHKMVSSGFQGMMPSHSRDSLQTRVKKERSLSPHQGKPRGLSREPIDGRIVRKDDRDRFKPDVNFTSRSNVDNIPIESGYPPPPKFVRSISPPKGNLNRKRKNSPGPRPNAFYARNELSSSHPTGEYRGNPRDLSPDMPLSKSPARFASGGSDWKYSGHPLSTNERPMREEPHNEFYANHSEGRRDYEKQPYGEKRRSRSFSPSRQAKYHDNKFIPELRNMKPDDPLAQEHDCRAIILQKRLTTIHDVQDPNTFPSAESFPTGEDRQSRGRQGSRQSPSHGKGHRGSSGMRKISPRLGKDHLSKRGSPEGWHSKKPVFDRLDSKKPPVFERLQPGAPIKKSMIPPGRGYPPRKP